MTTDNIDNLDIDKDYLELIDLIEKTTNSVNNLFLSLDKEGKLPFKRENFNRYEYNLLTFLYSCDHMSLSNLARELGMKLPYLSKAITRLVNKGLIERYQRQGCRRTYYAKLSHMGKELVKEQLCNETATIKQRFNQMFASKDLDKLIKTQQTVNDILAKL